MRNLTEGNIHKSFLSYSIPVILSSLLGNSFGIINSSIAGLFLGARGIAATGATGDFFTIINSVMWGYIMGLSVYIAGIFAAGKYKHLKRIVNTNLLAVFLFSISLMLISIIFNRPIISFLKVDPEIFDEARLYFFILAIQMLLTLPTVFFHNVLNAMGDTKFPLVLSFVSSTVNVLGNLLAVAVFDLGVLGLGLSSLFSSSLSFIAYYLKLNQYYKILGVNKYRIKPRVIYITRLFSYTIPVTCQQISLYITNIFMAPIKNSLGYLSVAALSITTRLNDINVTVYQASTKAGGQYIAQCVGAKKYDKIKKAIGVTLMHGFLLFLPLLITIWCAPRFVCSIFINIEEEVQVYEYVYIYIKYFLPCVLLSVATSSFHSISRGLKSTGHLLISSLIGSISRLILSFFFVKWYGLIGLFIGTAAAPVFEMIYVAIVYKSGLWWPKNIRQYLTKPKKHKANEV